MKPKLSCAVVEIADGMYEVTVFGTPSNHGMTNFIMMAPR